MGVGVGVPVRRLGEAARTLRAGPAIATAAVRRHDLPAGTAEHAAV